MPVTGHQSLANRLARRTGRLRDRMRATISRAQLGPARETELRAFLLRR